MSSPTGQLALTLSADVAVERAEAWCEEAREWVHRTRWQGPSPFTADDLTRVLGMPPGISRNAVGGLFHLLAKENVIEAVGWTVSKRPERRGAAIRLWQVRA